MKKLILLVVCQLFFLANVNAGGTLTVTNNTSCEVCFTVFAVCPDGTHYTHGTTICLPPNSPTQTLYQYGVGWLGPVWIPTAPPCDDWQWQYVVATMNSTFYAFGDQFTAYSFPLDIFDLGYIPANLVVVPDNGCSLQPGAVPAASWHEDIFGNVNILFQ